MRWRTMALVVGLGSISTLAVTLSTRSAPTVTAQQTATPSATATAAATASPAATSTAAVTATATAPAGTASPAATTAPTAAATATPARTPTAAPTAAPTPARTPTAAPTAIPQAMAQMAAPDCPGKYQSGAQQLAPRQTTVIRVDCTVRNPFNEPLDYTGTMVFALGPRASVAGGGAMRGDVNVVNNEIRWGGFTLAPGESVSAFAELNVSPDSADAGNAVVLFTSTTTTARVASGGFIDIRSGPFSTSSVSGLASGGFVLAAPAAGQPGTTLPAAAGLPRTGLGEADSANGRWLLLAGLLTVMIGSGVLVARVRR